MGNVNGKANPCRWAKPDDISKETKDFFENENDGMKNAVTLDNSYQSADHFVQWMETSAKEVDASGTSKVRSFIAYVSLGKSLLFPTTSSEISFSFAFFRSCSACYFCMKYFLLQLTLKGQRTKSPNMDGVLWYF